MAGFVLMLHRTVFRLAVGDEDNLPPVPSLGPGGVLRPDGEIGLLVILVKLEVELEGVDSIDE